MARNDECALKVQRILAQLQSKLKKRRGHYLSAMLVYAFRLTASSAIGTPATALDTVS